MKRTYTAYLPAGSSVPDLVADISHAAGLDDDIPCCTDLERRKRPGARMVRVTIAAEVVGRRKALTPAEFAAAMRAVKEKYVNDPEGAHSVADEILLKTLHALGYGAGVAVYENTKHY